MDKPMIRCPHCEEHIEAERLPPNRKYRNEFGMDVFGCPECGQSFRFEPSEYLVVRERLERGEVPEGVAIEAVKVDELLPSEQSAIDISGDRNAPAPRDRAKVGTLFRRRPSRPSHVYCFVIHAWMGAVDRGVLYRGCFDW